MRLDRGQIEVVDKAMVEVLRRKRPVERIQIGFSIWRSAQKILKAYLKDVHPEWNKEQIEKEVARRLANGAL